MRELNTQEVAMVSGGDVEIVVESSGGFWSSVLGAITGLLSSGRETSIPANNAELGFRG